MCFSKNSLPPTGLEPAIPGLGGRCLIHWATEAYIKALLNIDVFCVGHFAASFNFQFYTELSFKSSFNAFLNVKKPI